MKDAEVNIACKVEYELDVFRPGCSTAPPDAAQCVIYGVWLTLPCGRRLFNLGPFLEESELLELQGQIIQEAEGSWAADNADAAADYFADEIEVGHHG